MRSTVALVAMLTTALVLSTSLVRTGSDPTGRARSSVPSAEVGASDGASLRPLLRGMPGPAPQPDTATGRVEGVSVVSVVSAEAELADAIDEAVLGLDGVLATTRVRSATVGLFGSVTADGVPHDVLPAGMRIPVTVAAVDPSSYLDVLVDVSTVDAALVSGLVPGSVLMSGSAARLRGLTAGAAVELGGASAFVIAGVVDDAVTRGSEFLVHLADADADRVELGQRTSLLVRSSFDPSGESLASAFDRALGTFPEGEVRIRHGARQVPLVLSTIAVKERFGEFAFRFVPDQREVGIERRFVDEWITVERMPVLGDVRCHRLIMDDLRAAIEATVAAGLTEWLAPDRYGGCFNARRIAFGRENLSRHAWGIAIDLNVDFSQPGAGPVPPDEFVAIWGRHGFRWGGDFSTPDNHHFEWVGDAALVRPRRDGT